VANIHHREHGSADAINVIVHVRNGGDLLVQLGMKGPRR